MALQRNNICHKFKIARSDLENVFLSLDIFYEPCFLYYIPVTADSSAIIVISLGGTPNFFVLSGYQLQLYLLCCVSGENIFFAQTIKSLGPMPKTL